MRLLFVALARPSRPQQQGSRALRRRLALRLL